VNEYGFSDERITNGLVPGAKGTLKSSKPPANTFGVGKSFDGLFPEASAGVNADEIMPLFTLTTPSIKGPNDQMIFDEMDYNERSRDKSIQKRWFEMFKGVTKGIIWTIFEQSNRYFTMVDKREWDRYTPGKIFDYMQKFEYLVPVPDRILNARNPKSRTTEEKLAARFVLHDYSVGKNTIRVLVPIYSEFDRAEVLKLVKDGKPELGYISINTILTDAEMADGEKFTWNNPIKVVLYVDGNEYPVYMPTQAIIDINGKFYKLPKNLLAR